MKFYNSLYSTKSRRYLVSAGASALCLFACSGSRQLGAHAMMASPMPYWEQQPDGQRIRLRLNGDPYDAWVSDLDGYTVVRDPETHSFVYADDDGHGGLQPSHDMVVAPSDEDDDQHRSLSMQKREKHMRPSKRDCDNMICGDAMRSSKNPSQLRNLRGFMPPKDDFESQDEFDTFDIFNMTHDTFNDSDEEGNGRRLVRTTGTLRNLVIPLLWADHVNRTTHPVEDLDILMNVEGFHPLAPTGSVRNVFLENSYGALQLNSTVVDWVVVNNTERYFSDDVGGRSRRIWEAIQYALWYLDENDLVDFDYFDEDQDGKIDCITFLHSGYAAEFGGTDEFGAPWEHRLWSHKWGLYVDPFVSKSGVQVLEYHISSSVWGRSNMKMGRIGVIAHETGHFLGVPDMYDTNGGGIGLGCFDLMANSWGFDGRQYYPPHMSSWTKLLLGWVTPYFPHPGENEISAFQLWDPSKPQVFAITDGFPAGEFLLIENRQRRSYDYAMPQSGLIIYHVDHNSSPSKFRNSLNTEGHPGQEGWPENGNHYGIAVLQADGEYDLEQHHNSGDEGDFYNADGVNQLQPCVDQSDCQYPNTDSYKEGLIQRTMVHISDISESGDMMTFNYRVGDFESQAPSEAPSQSPTEWCSALGRVCLQNNDCCSGFCDTVGHRRFMKKCRNHPFA
ncbi:MAG: hypothetical protein SGILL_001570 [Bacillariaceae sp.]